MVQAPAAPQYGSGDITLTVQVGNLERGFLLHYPKAYYTNQTQKLPLILAFHGRLQDPKLFADETGLSDDDVNDEFMVAYPEGHGGNWLGSPEAPPKSQVNDLVFVTALLDHLCESYPVDPERVFLLGLSNGAGLTALVACDKRLSRRIRAVVMASSAIFLDDALTEPLFSKFESKRFPVPLLELHGDADPVIDYNGVDTPDGPSWPIGDWLRGYTWMMEKGMNDGEIIQDEAEEDSLYGGVVERYIWRCGTESDIVVHYLIHGFGHGWPTTTPVANEEERCGPTVFDATPVALEFFREAARINPFHIDWED